MKWHTVNLPDYFTHLLKINLTDHERTYRVLRHLIQQEEGFGMLIKKGFSLGRLDSILQSVGWFGFREQLAALFISKLQCGEFNFEVSRNSVDDLVQFEDRFKTYATSGFSRSFLLGFYLKIAFGDGSLQYYLDEMPRLLELSKSKAIKIDWVMVLLVHFDHYLGRKGLESILQDGIEFEDIFNFLKDSQKNEMIENLLSYGNSINEPQMFINDTV